MQDHKAKEHEFCSYCNQDFETWDDHHQHRIDMDSKGKDTFHINCYHCGLNLHTRQARDDHVKKTHAIKQKLECPICRYPKAFTNAEDFMWHVENDRCPRIKSGNLRTANIHKELVQAILENPSILQDKFQDNGIESDSDEEGGVNILDTPVGVAMSQALIPEKVDHRGGAPVHQQAWPKAADSAAAARSGQGIVRGMNAMTINSSNKGKAPLRQTQPNTPHRVSSIPAARTQKQFTSLADPPPNAWGIANASKKLFPNAKPTPGNLDMPKQDNSTNIFHHQFWNPNSKDFNPSLFLHPLTKIYTCPFPVCRYVIENLLPVSPLTSPDPHTIPRVISKSILKTTIAKWI
jgi:hypothetical protein